MSNKKLTHPFKTEIKKMLDIIINSLYKDKDIFVRELISNVSDAYEKLNLENLKKSIMLKDTQFNLNIIIDKKEKSIKFEDFATGMTKNEILKNLGTMAKSGTEDFFLKLKTKEKNRLIGNFGLGFYSVFMVASKVIVETKSMNISDNKGSQWISFGKDGFDLNSIEKKDHGTSVKLYLKSDYLNFLEENEIKKIVLKYSNYVSLTINIKMIQKSNKIKVQNITKNTLPIWSRNKNEITKIEYINFYKKISGDKNKPLNWIHFNIEGNISYIGIIYIPSTISFDFLLNKEHKGVKIYVKKVFTSEETKNFLPKFLRFVKGVIDFKDLPLNISKDIFYNKYFINTLKNSLIKRILNMITSLSEKNEKEYNIFWKVFGKILKEGIIESHEYKDKILELARFFSTIKNNKETVSLSSYIERVKNKKDKTIYYLMLRDMELANDSPHLKGFLRKKIEVLLLVDEIDEWVVSSVTKYKGFALKQINDINLDINKHVNDNEEKFYKDKIDIFKNMMQDKIKDIILSDIASDYPSRIMSDGKEITPQMEKILILSGHNVPKLKYLLELNKNHKLVKILLNETDEKKINTLIYILFKQALILEGKLVGNYSKFIKLCNTFAVNFLKKNHEKQ